MKKIIKTIKNYRNRPKPETKWMYSKHERDTCLALIGIAFSIGFLLAFAYMSVEYTKMETDLKICEVQHAE